MKAIPGPSRYFTNICSNWESTITLEFSWPSTSHQVDRFVTFSLLDQSLHLQHVPTLSHGEDMYFFLLLGAYGPTPQDLTPLKMTTHTAYTSMCVVISLSRHPLSYNRSNVPIPMVVSWWVTNASLCLPLFSDRGDGTTLDDCKTADQLSCKSQPNYPE